MQSSSSLVRSSSCVQWLPLVVLGYGVLLPATRAALLLLPIQSPLVAHVSLCPLTTSPLLPDFVAIFVRLVIILLRNSQSSKKKQRR